jgi:hypothetical protein
MLPVPFIKYIPKLFRDNAITETNALCDKADTHIEEWKQDVINIQYLLEADRCPSAFLNVLGNYVAAGIRNLDDDATKRQKIYNAIQMHIYRSTWEESAKAVIDAITGYDARLINSRSYIVGMNIWVECDGVNNVDTKWAPEGTGTDADYMGIKETCPGGVVEPEIPGLIYIDCHYGINVSTLTAPEIADIVAQLTDEIAPAYMIIYLCYINATGQIITYTGGTIS